MKHGKLDTGPDDPEDEDELGLDEQVVNSIDAYLELIGQFGRYQQLHYALVASAWIACSFCTLSMVFVNRSPEWRDPANGETFEGGLPCDTGEFEIINSDHSLQSEWGLYCDQEWIAGFLNSIFFVGFMLGAAALGGAADSMGRRRAFALSAAMTGGFALGCAAATGWQLYALLRMGVGVGCGGLGIVCYVFASEFVGPSWQAMQGVAQALLIFSGANVLLAFVAYAVQGCRGARLWLSEPERCRWRALTVVTGLTPFIWVAIAKFVDESPRWLQTVGELEAANEVMRKMSVKNNCPLNIVLEPPVVVPGTPREPTPENPSDTAKEGISDLCGATMRLRLWVMLYVWSAAGLASADSALARFANSFVYYGLSLNSGNLGGSLHFNFGLGLAAGLEPRLTGW